MFNESTKSKYIEEFNIRADYQSMFQRVSALEEKLNKDICLFSIDEAKDAIKTMGLVSMRSIKNAICLFRNYSDWCINNGMSSSNPFDDIKMSDPELIPNIVNKTPHSYEEVVDFLDTVFCPITEESSEISYRACVWLAYFGFTIGEIEQLTTDNYEDGVVEAFGIRADLNNYLEAKLSINSAICLKRVKSGFGYRELYQDGHIIRTMGDRSKFSRLITIKMSTIVHNANKIYGSPIYSVSDIERAGLFIRMYDAEKISMIERNNIANSYVYLRYNTMRDGVHSDGRVQEAMRSLMNEYKAWKQGL